MAARGFYKILLTKWLGARHRITFDGAGDGIVQRIACLGSGSLACKLGSERTVFGRSGVKHVHEIVGKDMLQKEMKTVSMILMSKMTQFMQEHIVLKHTRQAHDGKIQVYISLG